MTPKELASECPECGSKNFTHASLSEGRHLHLCKKCGHSWALWIPTDSDDLPNELDSDTPPQPDVICPHCNRRFNLAKATVIDGQ